ncbi:hypothetical protein V5O48_012035 [Marasmius crinis-equi]|uniref:Uncharacterized protein n=1 Tax=Marasmius crinis-equi TaxID=585013 RepID=A0ABR3F4A7_9AGAR
MTDSPAPAATNATVRANGVATSPSPQPPVERAVAEGSALVVDHDMPEVTVTQATQNADPDPVQDTDSQASRSVSVAPPTDIVKEEEDEPKSKKSKKSKTRGGHVGGTGRYVFSDDQVAILSTKLPGFRAAPKKAQYAREVYDELKVLPAFVKPDEKTKAAWKYSITRWLENHAKPKAKACKASGEVSNPNSPNPKSLGINPGEGGGVVGTDGTWKVKALTRLFNKLVNGLLTLPTGREAFGEAHAAMLSRTMSETNDYDPERVLDKLWDAVSPKNKEDWEEAAKKESPVLENQEGFANGLRALIQSCLRSGYLGRAGVAVFFCFDKDSSADGKPVFETSMVNEWWDPGVGIPENDMLLSGGNIMSKLLDNLTQAVQQLEFDTLILATEFPIDAEGNARFPVVDTDDLRGSEARTMLSDWYRRQWVQSGRRGPIRYIDIVKSPDQFYDQDDLPFGMKIADPADNRMTSSSEVQALLAHFMANFGVVGRVFSFKAPREPSEDPTTPVVSSVPLSSDAVGEDEVDIVNDEGNTHGEEVAMKGRERATGSGASDESDEDESDEDESDEEESDSDEDSNSDSDSEHGGKAVPTAADTQSLETPPVIGERARQRCRSSIPSLPPAMTPSDMPSVDGKDQATETIVKTHSKALSEERIQQPNGRVFEPIPTITNAEVANTVKAPAHEVQAVVTVCTPSLASPTDGTQLLDGQADEPQVSMRAETVNTLKTAALEVQTVSDAGALKTTAPEVRIVGTINVPLPESPKKRPDATQQLDGQASEPLLALTSTENVSPIKTPSPAQSSACTTTGPVESLKTHSSPAVQVPSAEQIPAPTSDMVIPAQGSKKSRSRKTKSRGTADQEGLGVSQSESGVKKRKQKPKKEKQTAAEQAQPETPGKKRKRDREEDVQGSGSRVKKLRTQQTLELKPKLTTAPEDKAGKPSYDYVWEPANKKGTVQLTPKKDTVEGRVTTRRQLAQQVAP